MKNGKKLTRTQKQFLQSKGMTEVQSNEYLVVKNTPGMLVVVHRSGGDPVTFKK